jgi:predicted metalloendopeptidase
MKTRSNITIINAYRNFIISSVLLLREGKKLKSEENETMSMEVEEIIQFEQELARGWSFLRESRLYPISNPMNFFVLNEAVKSIDFLDLINQIYVHLNSSIRVNGSEKLIVEDILFFQNMIYLLKNTPKRVLANYIGWRLTKKFGYFTIAKFRSNEFEFNKIINGLDKNPPLNEYCLGYIRESMMNILSRIYIDGQTNFLNYKSYINSMIHDLKESFKELIVTSDWLDQQTRNKSLQKLDKIMVNIGYPDWIMNNSELDKFNDLKEVASLDKAFESMLYIEYNNGLKSFEKLRKPVNRTMK